MRTVNKIAFLAFAEKQTGPYPPGDACACALTQYALAAQPDLLRAGYGYPSSWTHMDDIVANDLQTVIFGSRIFDQEGPEAAVAWDRANLTWENLTIRLRAHLEAANARTS